MSGSVFNRHNGSVFDHHRHNLQLTEQRREAAREREYAAIADLIAAADRSLHIKSAEHVDEIVLAMTSAWVRWRFEVNHRSLSEEMVTWPSLVGGLAAQHLRQPTHGSFDKLLDAVSTLRHTAMSWPAFSSDEKVDAVNDMKDARNSLDPDRVWT